MKQTEPIGTDNATEIGIQEAVREAGYQRLTDVMQGTRPGVPACCSYGCTVEPDGECRHGHKSVLRKAGLI